MPMWHRRCFLLLAVAVSGGCADWITDIPPFAEVDVTASRRSGEPVPGAAFTLYTGARIIGTGVAGSDGSYRFNHLAQNSYGVYAEPPVGFERPEVLLGGPTTAWTTTGLSLTEGGYGAVDFTYLKVGPGTIRTQLVDPAGAGLSGVNTVLYSASGSTTHSPTNSDGQVAFESIPFGMWGIRFEVPPELLETGQRTLFRDGLLVEEGSDTSFVFTAPLCRGAVNITVEDDASNPVDGYPVEVYNDRGQTFDGVTEADGRMTFGAVFCGYYGARLKRFGDWDFPDGRGTGFVDGLVVLEGSTIDVSFAVSRCDGDVAVNVVDDASNPVAAYPIQLYDDRAQTFEGVTGADGRAVFDSVSCGNYGVRLQPSAGWTFIDGRGTGFVDGLVIVEGSQLNVSFTVSSS